MSGLCDSCIAPGHCCKRMVLSGGLHPFMLDQPMSLERAEHEGLAAGLPFVPGAQLEDGRWEWACYQLGEDGRCKIYDRRPQVCRDFKPGSGPLCVHYWAPPLDEDGTGGTSPGLVEGTEKPADS